MSGEGGWHWVMYYREAINQLIRWLSVRPGHFGAYCQLLQWLLETHYSNPDL
jgi:hypothetical protein